MDVILQFVHDIRAAYGTAGWAAGLGAFFFSAVTVYRLPLVQKILGWFGGLHAKLGFVRKYLLWDNWTPVTKTLVVVIPLGAAAFFTTFATGGGWVAAAGAAVGAVATAMGSRKLQKQIFTTKQPEHLVGTTLAATGFMLGKLTKYGEKDRTHKADREALEVEIPNAPVIGEEHGDSDSPGSSR